MKKHIVIISPALANANNGNWQTASRWARMLRASYRVSVLPATPSFPEVKPDVVIALHARRSADVLVDLHERFPDVPSVLVLTGTDLYRDIRQDAKAKRSLQIADRLVVLQEAGLEELDADLRAKTSVIYQSARSLTPIEFDAKLNARHFDICMIGHLRVEKDPVTFMRAAELSTTPELRFFHIGGDKLDSKLGEQARKTQKREPRYRWLGDLPHAETRQRLKRCQLMVIASRMEGGANVIIEAVTSGVPVLASNVPGNRGMLGKDYAGYFPVGDSEALARLIERAASDLAYYRRLYRQCQARAQRFTPELEQAALLKLMDNTLRHASRKEDR